MRLLLKKEEIVELQYLMGNSVLFLFDRSLAHVEDGMSLHYIYDIIFQLIQGLSEINFLHCLTDPVTFFGKLDKKMKLPNCRFHFFPLR